MLQLNKIPILQKAVRMLRDKAHLLFFWIRTKERKRNFSRFLNCRSVKDYFQFSSKIFGLNQIKQEIIDLVDFIKLENPKNLCEIGTARGGTNFLLSQALPSAELMIGVDLYVENSRLLRYFSRKTQQIIKINGSSHSKKTVKKISELYGLNESYLYYLIRNKKFPFYKIDKKVLIETNDFETFLENHKIQNLN